MINKQLRLISCGTFLVVGAIGCSDGLYEPDLSPRLVPAEEFSNSVRAGKGKDFSIFRTVRSTHEAAERGQLMNPTTPAVMVAGAGAAELKFVGDPKLTSKGFTLKKTMGAQPTAEELQAMSAPPQPELAPASYQEKGELPGPPPGSAAPYYQGQMTDNPSLWPDEGQGSSLFRDFRAFEPMDIVTIIINEKSEGNKKADTDTESKFSLIAAIKSFFGLETKSWASNNAGLDPSSMIDATTNTKFEGTAETKRSGTLKGKLSAVIMEVLPNGVLRVEGTKIMAVNNEEEIMVVSGLIRNRDIDAVNQVDSSRIANMRVDFYGRGVMAEHQSPGWGARIFEYIWPF